jgi:hypothetical protein
MKRNYTFKTINLKRAVHNAHHSHDHYFDHLYGFIMRVYDMPEKEAIAALERSKYLRAFVLATIYWTSFQYNDLDVFEKDIEYGLNDPYYTLGLLYDRASGTRFCMPGKKCIAAMYKRVLAAERR